MRADLIRVEASENGPEWYRALVDGEEVVHTSS